MKSIKRKSNFKSIVIIIIVLILFISFIFILLNTKLFEKDAIQNNSNVEFKLPFEEKEYENLVGYDFYTKDDGTVLIKSNVDYEMSNISSEGVIINVNEKVVKIVVYELVEGNAAPSNVLMLTENGNLYSYDLGQTILDNAKLYKYNFNLKIKDIKSEVLESILYYDISVVELENGEIRVVGPRNILLSPVNYSIGKKIATLSLERDYIVIENDNKIRIGDASKDKYFNISSEKWINENADVANYLYLKDESGLLIKAKDFQTLNNDDITNIYIITDEKKLLYLSVSYKTLTEDSKILEKYEIKLNKPVIEFAFKGSIGTATIKFEDGTYADIKDDNLIFGMFSKNNNFFTFSKQSLKNNIEYKILTDKSGVNYKIKDYQIVYDVLENGNIYIINVFMITEDNKMVMTRVSNDQQENLIDEMKVEVIDSEKLIDKFDRQFSDYDGYTTKIVFKDGTKIDFDTFIKDYLSLG